MKKTIFDLTYAEGKKIDRELRRTSYYRQYVIGYITIMVLLTLLSCIEIVSFLDGNTPASSSDVPMIFSLETAITILGYAITTLLFWFKRFDLVKNYYEQKYVKEDK